MPALTVRKLSVETHAALKKRAALKGKSTEAEVRAILSEAVRPKPKVGFGTVLQGIARKHGAELPDFKRDATPLEPATFE